MINKDYSIIDFHSHFLPNMDDGSRSVEESIQMLQNSYRQGVDQMVATPHFYADRNTIAHFLTKRNESYTRLLKAAGALDDIPRISLGAEVLYFPDMSHAQMLHSLCIEQTNTLLLEMPFVQWSDLILHEIDQLVEKRHLCVVIAHLDRYLRLQKNPTYLHKLLQMPVKIQLNADAFLRFRRQKVLRLVKEDRVDALGSDCHNMRDRKPNLAAAADVIQNKLGESYLIKINEKCRCLIAEEATLCEGE